MKNKVIRPFSFEEPSVTGDTFPAKMENNALCHVPVRTVLELDGASPHFSHNVCAFLDRKLPDHWIEREVPIPWPLHSPDLNPMDYSGGL
jgi:hypothetical protein